MHWLSRNLDPNELGLWFPIMIQGYTDVHLNQTLKQLITLITSCIGILATVHCNYCESSNLITCKTAYNIIKGIIYMYSYTTNYKKRLNIKYIYKLVHCKQKGVLPLRGLGIWWVDVICNFDPVSLKAFWSLKSAGVMLPTQRKHYPQENNRCGPCTGLSQPVTVRHEDVFRGEETGMETT